jgi:hypothetical protein
MPTTFGEFIKAAALRVNGQQVYTGPSHAIIFDEAGLRDCHHNTSLEDGFVTSTGRFVSRIEAGQIMYGQDWVLDSDCLNH